jgi:hypothetical protein
MKTLFHSRNRPSKGAALIIVLALVVLLTGLTFAYFSRTTTERQLAHSSYNDTSADLLARSALDIMISSLKQEILNGGTTVTPANIQPQRSGDDASIPNLIRRSARSDALPAPGVPNLAAAISSGPVDPTNPKRGEVTSARWNKHYLIPRRPPIPPENWNTIYSDPVSTFVPPDWVLVTAQGPNPAPVPSAVIGRYAFAVYDEGGLLDMNLAGYSTWTQPGGGGGGPNATPTPWPTNIGRKGIITFADLTALPAPPSTLPQSQISNIVGWRNYSTTRQTGSFFPTGTATFKVNDRNAQDSYGSYLMDFGDPPYPSPCPSDPLTSVDTSTSSGRTDQAVMMRQELLKLQRSLGFSQNALQCMGTFSRERNQPARDWNRLNNRLADRFDLGMLGMVKPNPTNTANGRGRGQGHGNGGNFKGRGHYRGDALSIRDLFGLVWVPGDPAITDPHNVKYWGHWLYVGTPPLPNGNPHIPILRGGRNDLMQILDYCTGNQANADNDDADPQSVATILSLGASLIDQYDNPGDTGTDDVDTVGVHQTGTHVTIIAYGDGGTKFVLGWESNEAPAATDTDPSNPHNPYNWITDTGDSTGTKKSLPSFPPIVLNHGFSTSGDLGYGLKTENAFRAVDFHSWPQVAGSIDAALLDFFTYNPVDHNYPRIGIANLNTKNVSVLAAIIQSALKKDIDVSPIPSCFPTVSSSEATAAAQAIVSATTTQPVLNRADIVRVASVAAGAISTPACVAAGEETQKVAETIARALSEVTQARTWNLFIDVIAQTGRYAPGTTNLTDTNKFTVEGEKRYWLHIALGRDLDTGTIPPKVDVLGTQLEEVIE